MLLRLFTNVDSVEKLTKSFVSKCEITPPARVADISRGQEFEDSEIFSVCIQCSTEIPLRSQYVAHHGVRHGEVALPPCVARITCSQSFQNR